MDIAALFVHDHLREFQRHHIRVVLVAVSAQGKVHTASADNATRLPEPIVGSVTPAWLNRRAFIIRIKVIKTGCHVDVHIDFQRYVAVADFLIQLSAGGIHHVEVKILHSGNHIGDRIRQPVCLYAVTVRIFPPFGIHAVGYLESALNPDLHGGVSIFGVGGISGDNKSIVQFVMILVICLY